MGIGAGLNPQKIFEKKIVDVDHALFFSQSSIFNLY